MMYKIKSLGLTPIFTLLACNAIDYGKSTRQGDDIENGIVNQAALIQCNINRVSDGSTIRKINSLDQEDAFGLGPRFIENEIIEFDCHATSDESPVGELIFEFADSGDTGPFVVQPGAKFNYSLSLPKDYPMALRVTDPIGLSSIKSFVLPVSCAANVRPALVINPNAISITNSGLEGYFNYDAGNAVTGGGGTYSYAWDFNGDGLYDRFDENSTELWGPSSSQEIYTMYSDARTVGLQVRDSLCNYYAYTTFTHTFSIDRIAAGNQAVMKPFYYLQADLNNLTATATPMTVAEFTAVEPTNAPEPVKVDCAYNAGVFEIDARHLYGKNTEANLDERGGMFMRINDIPDDLSASQAFTSAVDGIKIDSLRYRIHGSTDTADDEVFQKQDQCDVALRLQRATAMVPCDSGPSVASETITILGEFSCPILATSGGSQIEAQNGAFFCEVGRVDKCVGGGGGSGGGIPEVPQ